MTPLSDEHQEDQSVDLSLVYILIRTMVLSADGFGLNIPLGGMLVSLVRTANPKDMIINYSDVTSEDCSKLTSE